jgi:hypothetical protein
MSIILTLKVMESQGYVGPWPNSFEPPASMLCRSLAIVALLSASALVERFQSSNHMGCPKWPPSVDGKPKMQLSGFMESVVYSSIVVDLDEPARRIGEASQRHSQAGGRQGGR